MDQGRLEREKEKAAREKKEKERAALELADKAREAAKHGAPTVHPGDDGRDRDQDRAERLGGHDIPSRTWSPHF